MTLDTFLKITAERVPTTQELIDLADSLEIKFLRAKSGNPVMRPCPECRDETLLLAKLFRREPFRSAVIAAKLPDEKQETKPVETNGKHETPENPREFEPSDDDSAEGKEKVNPPPGAQIFIADADGYFNHTGKMKGPPYMWTWEGAKTWYYVSDHPLP